MLASFGHYYLILQCETMLSYFPAPYPDELLYSVLARFSLHIGSPGSVYVSEALFGKRNVVATFDLPGHLDELCNRLPKTLGFSADIIIDKHSLFPYFTRFVSADVKREVRAAMHGNSIDGIHLRLGIAAFRVQRMPRLRFCHKCSKEMLQQYGELYWCRDHQLPGVLVCSKHTCFLSDSLVQFYEHNRHMYIAATLKNCSEKLRSLTVERRDTLRLQEIAIMSVELLNQNNKPRSFEEWTRYYRGLAAGVGLTRSQNTMDQKAFFDGMCRFYGSTLELIPNVKESDDFLSSWLSAITRKHRKAFHPLYHLLVQNYLIQCEQVKSPFGEGPWPCRNPLAKHRAKAPIKKISTHRNKGKLVGVFSCQCGYVYTRNYDSSSSTLGPPRFLKFGPLLESSLIKMILSGVSLRRIGRVLNLDPKTVIKLCKELRVETPWNLKGSGKESPRMNVFEGGDIYLTDKVRTHRKKKHISKKRKPKRRLHWHEIDQLWVKRLKNAASNALSECPPVRVSIAELERRNGRRGWLGKRKHLLPNAMAYLNRAIESKEDFQLRRITWAIAELERIGTPIKVWRVIRKAGLHSGAFKLVKNIIIEREEHVVQRTA